MRETNSNQRISWQWTSKAFNDRIDEDIQEKIDLFMQSWSTITTRHFTDGKLKMSELVIWEKRLQDTLGFKMKDFVTYIRETYKKRKDSFVLLTADIPLLLLTWAIQVVEERMKEEEKKAKEQLENPDDQTQGDGDNELDQGEFPPPSPEELERAPLREKARDMLQLKIAKHTEKIEEIFKNYQPAKEGASQATETGPFTISLENMDKILKDLAYLTGLTISTFDEYKVNSHDKKKFKPDMVNAITHFFWLKNQRGIAMAKGME